ncbi:MAG: M28 family peptidase, partial [Clostridia bacterium]
MEKFDKMASSRESSVNYICEEIKKVITTFDKRDAGGRGERQAEEYMQSELDKYTDRSFLEDYTVCPKAFYGWIRFGLVMMFMSLIFYFFVPILSVCLMFVTLFVSVGEFILYRQVTDKLHKKKTSCNVTALKKPVGEVKRRILLNGHADAAWEWSINYRFGGKTFTVCMVTVLAAIFSITAASIIAVCFRGAQVGTPDIDPIFWLGIAMFGFVPIMCVMWFFNDKKIIVDGANDNLTGCYVPIAIMKALKENNINLENTEVGVIITGSEEIGLRGAKAWAKAHKDEFSDVPTFIIAYDTLYESNCLNINDVDLNNICYTDKDVCSMLKMASQNVGANAKFYNVTVGATDAAAFSQAGFKSACVTALDHSLKPYYHTRRDS